MTLTSRERATQDRLAFRRAAACLAVALAAPLLAFIAALGLRTGLLDLDFGYGILTMKAAWGLSWVGAAAAVGAVIIALRSPRAAGVVAGVAVLAAGATLSLFLYHFARSADRTAGFDVSTNAADPPGYSDQVRSRRAASGADAPVTNPACAVAAVQNQVAPGVAAYALQQAGFEVPGFGVGRADGTRTGFWFGRTHDAVVRIRPGRTDVRVTARRGRYDDGEACRLTREIVAALQVAP